jgi:hypothetical protein
VASAWIVTRTTRAGERRFRVEYRLGGREAPTRYAGSFKVRREALERKRWLTGELAAKRVPDLSWNESVAPTFAQAAKEWQAARVDIAESTRDQHRIQLDKFCR